MDNETKFKIIQVASTLIVTIVVILYVYYRKEK